MYNRYLSTQPFEPEPLCAPPEPPCGGGPHETKQPAGIGGLLQNLTGRFGEIKFDADTLIAIAVIWFLLSDGGSLDTDVLIIIGVLIILGI